MLARRPKSAQAVAMRARIVLGCNEGLSNGAVAEEVHITGATVGKWRQRFRVNRIEGLLLADLGVTKTHSRPHVSDDNPYSEVSSAP